MNYRNRRRWRLIYGYWIGWALAFIFLTLVRGSGTRELGSVQFEQETSLLVSVVYGIFFGTLSALARNILKNEFTAGCPWVVCCCCEPYMPFFFWPS